MSRSPTSTGSAVVHHLPDLSAEGDADLLVYMTMRAEDPAHAREAWAEFYRRHVRYVFGTCRRLVEGLPRPPTTVEQEVLRVTYQYHVAGRDAQRLPNDVAEDLSRRLNTTSENLRKIRQRATDKLRAALAQRFGPLPDEA